MKNILPLAIVAVGVSLLSPSQARADEGMWTFDAVPRDAIAKKYGFKITDAWLENVRLSAVKIRASGSFVSGDGLVMTNQHVATSCEEMKIAFTLVRMRERLGPDDPAVKAILGREAPEEIAKQVMAGTTLTKVGERRRLWEGGATAIAESTDPLIRLARAVDREARVARALWEKEVEGPEDKHGERIASAVFRAYGTARYPDATGTLRLSYGVMKGYSVNGKSVPPFTTFRGAFDRHTGKDPFDLPRSWLAARDRLGLETPFNFVSTHDIHGGNSGSPVINTAGEIVGLVFDRNLQGLGSAFLYDDVVNRCVSVHSEAIMHALANVYRAERVRQELLDGKLPGAGSAVD